ncbi:GtrA family protein [Candidatus Parcubacteria bacterium]|jgi:putative flippase GtrA|nr:GtrA family protein [Candidatus Parcubacteria bacterium]MBT7228855.1 GtrA family protein [Candidatus Parcubacteria bacterium]
MKFLLDYLHRNRFIMSKYAVVGFSSMIIDLGVLYILTEFADVHYLMSATISFVMAAFYNYNLNRRWTFQSSGSKTKQVPVFLIIAGIGLLLNNNILFIGVRQFGLWYIYAKVLAIAIVTSWNFFGNKYLTFKIK